MTDHHDEFDRSLTDRLAAAESRVPPSGPPDLAAAPRADRRLPLAIGGVAFAAVVGLAMLLPGVLGDQTGEASPTPGTRTAAAGLTFVLPPGWNYRVPPSEYTSGDQFTWPRIYFSNTALRDDLGCVHWLSNPGAVTCAVLDQLPEGGVLLSWSVGLRTVPVSSAEPYVVGNVPGDRAALDDSYCGLSADAGEVIRLPAESDQLDVIVICSRRASAATLAQLDDLLESIAFDTLSTPTASATSASTAAPTSTPTALPSPNPIPSAALRELVHLEDPSVITFVSDVVPFLSGHVAAVVTLPEPHVSPAGPLEADTTIYLGDPDAGWTPVDTGTTFQNVDITDLYLTPSGQLGALGIGHLGEGIDGMVAFTSADGVAWSPIEVNPDQRLFAAGPKGFVQVLLVWETLGSDPVAIPVIEWSADGQAWETVYRADPEAHYTATSLAAGDEGFVIVARKGLGDAYRMITLASGDGRTWLESPEQPALADQNAISSVVALGGDWIAAGYSAWVQPLDKTDGEIPVLWSANGLDWQRVATITDPAQRDGFGFPGHLVEAGNRVFLSVAMLAEGVETRPRGVWSSTDGRNWTMLELGDETEIRTAVDAGDGRTLFLGGRIGNAGGDAILWAVDETWFDGE
jgi:hypothetical protein